MFIAWCIAWALDQCDWILLFPGLYFKIRPASHFCFVVIILFYYIVIVYNKLFYVKEDPWCNSRWRPRMEIQDGSHRRRSMTEDGDPN